MISIFFGSFLVGLSGAVAPGPLMMIAISQSAKGWKNSIKLISGHVVLEAFLVLLLVLGFQWVLKSPLVTKVIGLLGGSFLAFMGISQLTAIKGEISQVEKNDLKIPLPITGALVSLSNPYFLLWWMSVGSAFLVKAQTSFLAGVTAFYFGHILSDILWYSLIGVFGNTILKSSRIYKIVMAVTGLFLIGFGLFFVLDSFR
ncbi:lysine exporter protein LysE/YggA [Thermotoga sp. TBGT1765]|uniref:Lysine exporter protein (LYSE/YGGA) n=2 Tax=Thermotogaceae TaxID=188709 RepID=A5IK68_THEP1|nr:LysE family translocator [Thermotoga sp. Cell2]ABQ46591.1 Lysine exporter protein (LYSE/YGGA) [Thermotoga petrophila RKU-1]KHC90996.1 lysine exporter protein LysE/YggA [Thermotoga sp. TBGT1765]KHC91909.1 lysine exporter protein LysE/YggA [Thermotoga sp. TBGT1766]